MLRASGPFEVLGLKVKLVDKDKLKKKYRQLSMQVHPDKNPSKKEDAQKCFQLVAEAYKELSQDGVQVPVPI